MLRSVRCELPTLRTLLRRYSRGAGLEGAGLAAAELEGLDLEELDLEGAGLEGERRGSLTLFGGGIADLPCGILRGCRPSAGPQAHPDLFRSQR
jgi:hypothetical protein